MKIIYKQSRCSIVSKQWADLEPVHPKILIRIFSFVNSFWPMVCKLIAVYIITSYNTVHDQTAKFLINLILVVIILLLIWKKKLLLHTKNLEKVVCPRKSCLVTTKLQNHNKVLDGLQFLLDVQNLTQKRPWNCIKLLAGLGGMTFRTKKCQTQESMDRRTQTGWSKRLFKLSLVGWGNTI